MSAFRRPGSDYDDDLAFGDLPETNKWDRDRFDRMREDMDRLRRPPRAEPMVAERPRGRDFARPQHDDHVRVASRVRREIVEQINEQPRALRHEPREEFDWDRDHEIIIERERGERPAQLQRRQSSLDSHHDRRRQEQIFVRERHVSPPPAPPQERVVREEVREYIHRAEPATRSRAKSDVRSVASGPRSVASHHSRHSRRAPSDYSSSSRESISEHGFEPAGHDLPGKKGFSRLPKSRFSKAALDRLGAPYESDGERWKVHRALDGSHLNDLLRWSNEMKEAPRKKVYTFEEDRLSGGGGAGRRERYEQVRREWINVPSDEGASSLRAPSPPRRSRAPSAPPPIININNQPPRPTPIIQPIYSNAQPPQTGYQTAPTQWAPPPPTLPMEIAVTQRTERTTSDIEEEIRRLNAERQGLQYERSGYTVVSSDQVYVPPTYQPHQMQLVPIQQPGIVIPYRPRSKSVPRPRSKSPKGEVIRVAKDKKGRLALIRSKR